MTLSLRGWRGYLQLLAFLAFASGSQPVMAASGKLSLEVDGLKRTAIIVEHTRLKKARRPLVIVLHGGNKGDGARIRRNLGMDDIFGDSGSVLVYPDAHQGHWNLVGKDASQPDDTAFFRAIVTKLVGEGMVDYRRVYVVGASLGGIMAMRSVCDDPELFAGIATVIANLPGNIANDCKLAKPVPLLMINGTADPRMPFKGGDTVNLDDVAKVLSTDETIKIFADAAGCSATIKESSFPNRNPKSGSRAFLDRYEGCKAPVELVRIEGGGHTIPGRWNGGDSGAVVGAHNSDVDAPRLIFDFFRKLNGA